MALTDEEIEQTAAAVLPVGWGFKHYPPVCWMLQMPNGRLATLVSCRGFDDVEDLASYLQYRMDTLETTGGM